jgi:hypothetical protein
MSLLPSSFNPVFVGLPSTYTVNNRCATVFISNGDVTSAHDAFLAIRVYFSLVDPQAAGPRFCASMTWARFSLALANLKFGLVPFCISMTGPIKSHFAQFATYLSM